MVGSAEYCKAMYEMSQSLIEELYKRSFIRLVDLPGLLYVKNETQRQSSKENYKGNKRSKSQEAEEIMIWINLTSFTQQYSLP